MTLLAELKELREKWEEVQSHELKNRRAQLDANLVHGANFCNTLYIARKPVVDDLTALIAKHEVTE